MAESSGISWCDATFNPWVGCTKVSPGCLGKHCYAETMVQGRMGRRNTWGPSGTRERTSPSNWAKPVRWNRLAAEGLLPDGSPNLDGHRPRVFTASLADVFEPRPEVIGWRDDLFDLIAETPNLDWLVLTKRPDYAALWLQQRFSRYWANVDLGRHARRPYTPLPWWSRDGAVYGVHPNLWVGTSIESTAYTWRADYLRAIPAPVRFISAEPLLGSLFTVPPERGPQGQLASGLDRAVAGVAAPAGERDTPSAGPLSDDIQNRDRIGTPGMAPADRDAQSGARPERLAPGTQGHRAPLGLDRDAPGTPGGATAAAAAQSGAGTDIPGSHLGLRPAPLDLTGIDWVIVGGESGGRNARPMHPAWAREIRDAVLERMEWEAECGDPDHGCGYWTTRPALHFKQWGSWSPDGTRNYGASFKLLGGDGRLLDPADGIPYPGAVQMHYSGAAPKSSGKLLDGTEWTEFPGDVLVPS